MQKKPYKTISVVGAGFMGTHISLHCAACGYKVWLSDISREALQRAAQVQANELKTGAIEGGGSIAGRKAILSRIHPTTDLKECASSADLVIEAVPERLELKRDVFARLDQVCTASAVLASTSSAIRISRIEDTVHRPDRVLNMHFYGRVSRVPMVELMRGSATSEGTMKGAVKFVRSIGLTPLVARKESTGFIFNRVWHAVKQEALRVVNEGVASHEDVDRAWMLFTGMPMGPFGRMDNIGLDVVRDIEMVYYSETGNESDAPAQVLLDKIARGELGVKTGKGFYSYPNPVFEDPLWLRDVEL